ncbi:MAG TPA: cyclic nucleotide-binding domain-containing protein [Spongiibacteraceae bacterium]|nr:cyclic nucleotide-binding domain-containing protein [Spongiibacteraceae bacterium]
MIDAEFDLLKGIMRHAGKLQKGGHLYRQEDPFDSVYLVRAGTFKVYRVDEWGEEQILGFYYQGDLIGVDGLSADRHICSAVALEPSSAYAISFKLLERLCCDNPALQRRLFQMIGSEIAREQQLMIIIGKFSAEQRVAAMLLGIAWRNKQFGLAPERLWMPMTRAEMGNYLGMAMESVSRVLSNFQRRVVVDIDGKWIVVHDIDKLCAIANSGHSEIQLLSI